MTAPAWRRSSKCEASSCVEVAVVGDGEVLVRDSKDPASPVLRFDRAEWATFVEGVRLGEFGAP